MRPTRPKNLAEAVPLGLFLLGFLICAIAILSAFFLVAVAVGRQGGPPDPFNPLIVITPFVIGFALCILGAVTGIVLNFIRGTQNESPLDPDAYETVTRPRQPDLYEPE